MLEECRHTFCKNCIDRSLLCLYQLFLDYLLGKKRCPLCNIDGQKRLSITPNTKLQKLVESYNLLSSDSFYQKLHVEFLNSVNCFTKSTILEQKAILMKDQSHSVGHIQHLSSNSCEMISRKNDVFHEKPFDVPLRSFEKGDICSACLLDKNGYSTLFNRFPKIESRPPHGWEDWSSNESNLDDSGSLSGSSASSLTSAPSKQSEHIRKVYLKRQPSLTRTISNISLGGDLNLNIESPSRIKRKQLRQDGESDKDSIDDDDDDTIYSCSKCGTKVHKGCCSLKNNTLSLVDETWTCDVCVFNFNNSTKTNTKARNTKESVHNNIPICYLCKRSIPLLAMQQVSIPNTSGRRSVNQTASTSVWIHSICAIWTPDVEMEPETTCQISTESGISSINKERWSLRCECCDQATLDSNTNTSISVNGNSSVRNGKSKHAVEKGVDSVGRASMLHRTSLQGAPTQCSTSSCHVALHASCALLDGLLLGGYMTVSGHVTYKLHCKKHSSKQLETYLNSIGHNHQGCGSVAKGNLAICNPRSPSVNRSANKNNDNNNSMNNNNNNLLSSDNILSPNGHLNRKANFSADYNPSGFSNILRPPLWKAGSFVSKNVGVISSYLSDELNVKLIDFCSHFNLKSVLAFDPAVVCIVIVSGSPAQRTVKLMQGIAAGCQVVTFSWVEACYAANSLIPTGPFEVSSDSSGGQGLKKFSNIVRSGLANKLPLHGIKISIVGHTNQLPKATINLLAKAAGADIVDRPKKPITLPNGIQRVQRRNVQIGDWIVVKGAALSEDEVVSEEIWKQYPAVSFKWLCDSISFCGCPHINDAPPFANIYETLGD